MFFVMTYRHSNKNLSNIMYIYYTHGYRSLRYTINNTVAMFDVGIYKRFCREHIGIYTDEACKCTF